MTGIDLAWYPILSSSDPRPPRRYIQIRIAGPAFHHMIRRLFETPPLNPVEVGDDDAGQSIDSHVAVDVDGVALSQEFVQHSDALGQLTAKVILVKILDRNPPNFDACLTVVGFQPTPIDVPVGHVVVSLGIQHRRNSFPA